MAITNFKIQDLTYRGPKAETGWNFFGTDLNATVGGDYIYCGYQLDGDTPIMEVDFIDYSSAQSATIDDWNWSPVDLNKGARGKYIYMYWRYSSGNLPITCLNFLITPQDSPPAIEGFTQVGCDLNAGAGGDYIWAYYSTTAQPNLNGKTIFDRET